MRLVNKKLRQGMKDCVEYFNNNSSTNQQQGNNSKPTAAANSRLFAREE